MRLKDRELRNKQEKEKRRCRELRRKMSRGYGKSKKEWSKKDKERSKRPEKLRLASLRKLAKDRHNSRNVKQRKSEQGRKKNSSNKKDFCTNKRSMKRSNS